jgi:hypothetical protein
VNPEPPPSLADLAALHGLRLATLDQNLIHASVDVIV